MTAIDYVARTSTGSVSRDQVADGSEVSTIWAGGAQEISFNLRQMDVRSFVRNGQNLEMTLADGRVVILENYFGPDGAAESRLFLSANGYLNEVELVEGAEGVLYAQYGPTEQWGKWSPSDELIFLDGADGVVVAGSEPGAGEEVSMLGAGLLGATGMFGAAGVGAAALAGTALLAGTDDGGGGPGGPARIEPGIDQTDPIVIGGDDAGPETTPITITGTAEPGSTVEVGIGDEAVRVEAADDGTWQAVFEGENFPDDGTHDIVAKVTEPDETVTDLTGPGVTIDTTPPDTAVLEGTVEVGDVINDQDYGDGIEITGTGEAGSSVEVTVEDVTRSTSVDENGEWRVVYEPGDLPRGEYTADVTVVSTDGMGNSTTLTEEVQIDTVPHPLEINEDLIGGDGVVNADEAASGFSVTGTTAPGAEVTLAIGGLTRTVTASETGEWAVSFAPGDLASGTYTADMTATTTDAAGNVTTTTGQFNVDTEAENFSMQADPGGADSVINGTEINDGLTVTGTTEPGSSVVVMLGTTPVDAVVAADGTWTASFTPEQIGSGTFSTTLTARTTDPAGNSETLTQAVEVDTEAGALTLNAAGIGGDGTVNLAEATAGVLVTGTADPGALVEVDFGGALHNVRADGSGNWQTTYTLAEVPEGDYQADVSATTTDAAGNSRSVEAEVHVDTRVDNLSVDDLNVAIGTDGTNVINADVAASGFPVTGTIEPGSSVTVTLAGISRAATVAPDGTWTAEFLPGELSGTEYMADLRIDVVDPAGNPASLSDQVRVDLLVNELTTDPAPIEGDDVINAVEAADGVVLAGQVEPGSSVMVDIFGKSYAAAVDGLGNWSLKVPGADIPMTDDTFAMVVTATDAAGNSSQISDSVTVDALIPDSPDLVGYFREGEGYRNVTLETTGDDVEIHQVAPGGSVSELSLFEDENAFLGETDYFFTDDTGAATTIPDGSQLVVTSTDGAGNAAATYVVLDETSTNTVDVGNTNLSQFQIETVDLRFGDRSELTLTEDQILALSDTTDQLVVRGGADDTVTMRGASASGSTTLHGQNFDIYTLGDDATVVVDDDMDVVT